MVKSYSKSTLNNEYTLKMIIVEYEYFRFLLLSIILIVHLNISLDIGLLIREGKALYRLLGSLSSSIPMIVYLSLQLFLKEAHEVLGTFPACSLYSSI
jgi:hypothetical protein